MIFWFMNRHDEGQRSNKCLQETCNHRECSVSPLHVAAEAGNTLLYEFILTRTEDKNPIVPKWRFDFELSIQEWTPLLAAAR